MGTGNWKYLSFTLILVLYCSVFRPVYGQDQLEDETPYYIDYKDNLNLRYYFSRKYTGLALKNRLYGYDLVYMPNSTLNMGVGATYHNLSLNLSYGFGFINPDRGRGDTRNIDLQVHSYPKKFVIDIFGQFYEGYYLHEPSESARGEASPLVFPDMKIRKIGSSVQYLFNHDKFSYRAAHLQNEWQQKSAGSFLAGFEMYGGHARNEKGIIPLSVLSNPYINPSRINYFEFGPNLGYVYTLVIKKHFFITASLASNLGFGFSEVIYKDLTSKKSWGVNPNYFLRGFAGYNSVKWSINTNYVYNRVNTFGVDDYRNSIMTGNYRFNFIYRIDPGPKLKNRLSWIEELKIKLTNF